MRQSVERSAFDHWYGQAESFLRKGQFRDAYWFEFLEGYENAVHPLGVDVVKVAWELAQKNSPPPEAQQFDSEEVRLLVGLCWQLQKLCGSRPFFLAARTVQKLLGHETHTIAARWLAGLCRSGILDVTERGGPKTGRASRYRYRSIG